MTTATAPDYRHARDIPDRVFIDAIQRVRELRPHAMVSRWDVASTLGGLDHQVAVMGIADRIGSYPTVTGYLSDVPGVPEKVVIAKAKRLIGRGLIVGCACGCRGDFEITPAGKALLRG